jgi:malate synthase
MAQTGDEERAEELAVIRRVLIHHRAGPLIRRPVTQALADAWYRSVLRDVEAVLDGTYREPEPQPLSTSRRLVRLLPFSRS